METDKGYFLEHILARRLIGFGAGGSWRKIMGGYGMKRIDAFRTTAILVLLLFSVGVGTVA